MYKSLKCIDYRNVLRRNGAAQFNQNYQEHRTEVKTQSFVALKSSYIAQFKSMKLTLRVLE